MNRAFALSLFLVACHSGEAVVSAVDARVVTLTRPSEGDEEAETPIIAGDTFADDDLVPCDPGAALEAALAGFKSLDARIFSLDDGPSAPTEPIVDALRSLLLTPCFELAAADLPDELEFDSGLVLKTWWWMDGGRDALERYLAGMRRPDRVVTPASPRVSFFLDDHESHPLAPLLCRSTDATCGQGPAAGWHRRADLELQGQMKSSSELEQCATEAGRENPPLERWAAYRACRRSRTPTRSVLPLGRFRAPTDGMLALAEPGGHGCSSFQLFDLATGTAFLISCHGSSIEIGRVSVSALREATWMLAMASLARPHHRLIDHVPVPWNIEPGRRRNDTVGADIGVPGGSLSSWRREWTWLRMRNGVLRSQVSGEVSGGGASTDANIYASTLLEIVTTGFVAGCAPTISTSIRRSVDWSRLGPRVYRPEDDPPFDFEQPDLGPARTAFATVRMPRACAAIP